jgi:hypothetical protein
MSGEKLMLGFRAFSIVEISKHDFLAYPRKPLRRSFMLTQSTCLSPYKSHHVETVDLFPAGFDLGGEYHRTAVVCRLWRSRRTNMNQFLAVVREVGKRLVNQYEYLLEEAQAGRLCDLEFDLLRILQKSLRAIDVLERGLSAEREEEVLVGLETFRKATLEFVRLTSSEYHQSPGNLELAAAVA